MKLLKGQVEVKVPTMPGKSGATAKHPVGGGGDLDSNIGGAPVAFGASSGALVAGTSVALDETQLGSGFRTGYFIDEIRVTAYTATHNVLRFYTGLGQLVRLSFQAGAHAFASHFPNGIPMGLLGPRFSSFDQGSAAQSINTIRDFARARFLLPKPLYMPPGDVLRCTAFAGVNPAGIAQPDITVNVTYLGRMLPQGIQPPLTRQVPWLAYFEKYFSNTETFAQTTDDFRNTFTKRVIVQRFTQRSALYNGSSWLDYTFAGSPVAGGVFVQARLDDSLGYAIVPQYVPIGPLFDEQSRGVWTFSRALGPKEQFNLQLQLSGTFAGQNRYNTQFGVVGYRDEAL